MDFNNTIKVLKGAESLLLILPKDVCTKLDIANHDWLEFEIKNRELVIKKIKKTSGKEEFSYAVF